jgi:hypothetical protein
MLEKGLVTLTVFVGIEIALVPGPSEILYLGQIQRCTLYSKYRRPTSGRALQPTVSYRVQVGVHLYYSVLLMIIPQIYSLVSL